MGLRGTAINFLTAHLLVNHTILKVLLVPISIEEATIDHFRGCFMNERTTDTL